MPRPPRIDVPGLPQHLVVRGHDRKPCFHGDDFRQTFLRLLHQAAIAAAVDVHAYVLMTNHVHLLVTGRESGSLSKLMHSLGRRYSRFVNAALGRGGALFESRFKSSLVQSERYFLACMRYIELNPVRAGMVSSPEHYPWSSHAGNASGSPGGLLSPHPEYLRLGSDPGARGRAYLGLFGCPLEPNVINEIRLHSTKERVLGDEAFRREISARLDRDVEVVAPGRPSKGGRKSNLVPF